MRVIFGQLRNICSNTIFPNAALEIPVDRILDRLKNKVFNVVHVTENNRFRSKILLFKLAESINARFLTCLYHACIGRIPAAADQIHTLVDHGLRGLLGLLHIFR